MTLNEPLEPSIVTSCKGRTGANLSPVQAWGDLMRFSIDVRDRSNIAHAVNIEMVTAYWHIGKEIVEADQTGVSREGKILHALRAELSWTHYRTLMRIKSQGSGLSILIGGIKLEARQR